MADIPGPNTRPKTTIIPLRWRTAHPAVPRRIAAKYAPHSSPHPQSHYKLRWHIGAECCTSESEETYLHRAGNGGGRDDRRLDAVLVVEMEKTSSLVWAGGVWSASVFGLKTSRRFFISPPWSGGH